MPLPVPVMIAIVLVTGGLVAYGMHLAFKYAIYRRGGLDHLRAVTTARTEDLSDNRFRRRV